MVVNSFTDVENHRASLFAVRSLLEPVKLSIPRLTRDQRHLDAHPSRDCWVRVENTWIAIGSLRKRAACMRRRPPS